MFRMISSASLYFLLLLLELPYDLQNEQPILSLIIRDNGFKSVAYIMSGIIWVHMNPMYYIKTFVHFALQFLDKERNCEEVIMD